MTHSPQKPTAIGDLKPKFQAPKPPTPPKPSSSSPSSLSLPELEFSQLRSNLQLRLFSFFGIAREKISASHLLFFATTLLQAPFLIDRLLLSFLSCSNSSRSPLCPLQFFHNGRHHHRFDQARCSYPDCESQCGRVAHWHRSLQQIRQFPSPSCFRKALLTLAGLRWRRLLLPHPRWPHSCRCVSLDLSPSSDPTRHLTIYQRKDKNSA